MTKKLFTFALAFAFLAGFAGINTASAADQVFPAGCSSAIGYSITNGAPCNGTGTATAMIAGCSSAIGYSITTGTACSGTGIVLNYLGGCSSIYGYSLATGAPCNGTTSATLLPTDPIPVDPTTPGLPTTGGNGSGPANNLLLLISSGVLAIAGITALARRSSVAR